MKPRHLRIPHRPVQVVNMIASSDRVCPYCQRTYDIALPMLGGNGVCTAYSHRIDRDCTSYCFHDHVMTDFDNDVDNDGLCVYEVDERHGEAVVA